MLDRSLPLLEQRQCELGNLFLKRHHLGFQASQSLDLVSFLYGPVPWVHSRGWPPCPHPFERGKKTTPVLCPSVLQPVPFPFRLTWSFFRRTHQAIARRCHYTCHLALASLAELPL
ncbi:MAG: hypothetical protein ABI413_00150 [Ktedonobacteraceae bacterium]